VIYVGDAASLIAASKEAADAVESSTGRISAASDKAAAANSRASASISKLGKDAAIGLVGAAAGAVDLAIKLEKATAGIQAAGGNSAATAKKMQQDFLSLGGTAEFSATKLETAYASIAGELRTVEGHALGASQALQVMQAAEHLTIATSGNLQNVTEALGKVMLTYGLHANQAAEASDVLFSASRNTGVSIETLITTLDRIHGRLGVLAPSLQESAGLMDDLAQRGVTGRLVMSALNGTFNTLLGGSKATTAMLKELGVNIFDSTGRFVGLDSVITQLQPKMAGLTQESQLEATKALFGATANKQMLDIILQGPQAFDKATEAVSRHGAAAAAAKVQSETLEGEFKKAKAAVEDLGAEVGTALLPPLTAAVHVGMESVEWLKKHEAAAIALGSAVGGVLGLAIAAYAFKGAVSFVNATKDMVTGLESLAAKAGLTATAVEASAAEEAAATASASEAMVTADAAAGTAAEGLAATTDAALGSTGVGLVLVGLGVAAVELEQHWSAAMKGLEVAAQESANAIISVLDALIHKVNQVAGALTLGLSPAIPTVGHLSGAGEGGEGGLSSYGSLGKKAESLEKLSPGSINHGPVEEQIMKFWLSKGFSLNAAAGFVGNAAQESSLNPGEAGGGLYQQSGYPASYGTGSVSQQSQHVLEHLSPQLRGMLNAAKSPQEAANLIMKYYEMPKGSQPGEGAYVGIANPAHREQAALEALRRAGGAEHAVATSGSGTLPSIEALTKAVKQAKPKAPKAPKETAAEKEATKDRKEHEALLAKDAKAGQAELNKMLAAIHAGGIKELSSVLTKTHDYNLQNLEKKLDGDHTSALSKLSDQLVTTHRKALEAWEAKQAVAFHEEITTLNGKIESLVEKAASAWEKLQNKAISDKYKDATEAIADGPEAKILEAEKDATEAERAKRTEHELLKQLKEAKLTGNKENVQKAEEQLTQFHREQEEKKREATIEQARKGASAAQSAEQESLEQRTLDYKNMLGAELAAQTAQLASGEVKVTEYVKNVETILRASGVSGLTLAVTGAEKATLEAGKGSTPGHPVEGYYTEEREADGHVNRVYHPAKASGGRMDPGITYTVGETGAEQFTPSVPGTITPASAGAGMAGPTINVDTMHVHHRRDAERWAHKMAHKLRYGGR